MTKASGSNRASGQGDSRKNPDSESFFSSIFRSSLDGMIVANDNGECLMANDAASEILGIAGADLIGRTFESFAEYRSDAAILWQKLLRTGKLRAEIALLRPTGERRQVEFTAAANVTPGRHLLTMRDLTHRRNLDEQIRNASKMEAVGRLAGGVAHDFNNLLMVVTSYTELMLESMSEDDPLRKKAQEILKASHRAATLTRQLLAFSRKQVLDPQIQDLNSLVRDMNKMLGRVLGEDIKLDLALEPNLGLVCADRGQIEQVLMHLAVNARDVMPEGGRLTVRTSNVEFDESFATLPGSPPPGSYVMLAVEDTGAGMSRDVLTHLFEPFFSTKGMGKASGLGLAAVYGVVKQSGGYIWVDSEVGKGSRFHMHFPRLVRPQKQVPEVKPVAPRLAGPREVILLVEDEDALRQAAADFLETRGYRVLAARDGAEALAIATSHPSKIHVLITDLVMPGISGRIVAQELKKIHPETLVMYMSGYNDAAVVESAAMDRAGAFLKKPFGLDALSTRIRELLGSGGTHSRPASDGR